MTGGDEGEGAAKAKPRWRRGARAAYLILVNTLALLVLLEAGWRLVHDVTTPEDRKARAFAPPDRVGYTLHPFMQMANPPDERTDAGPHMWGWRVDPPGAVMAPNRLRILFLGGSTTNTDYPSFVRQQLEPALGAVTVYNVSFDWHCSLHSLYKFWTYVDEIHPDLVVVLHNINDFYRGFTPPRYSLPQYRADYSHYSGAMNLFWSVGKSKYDQRPVFYARPGLRVADRLDPPDRSFTGMLKSLVAGSEVLRGLREAIGGERLAELQRRAGVQDAPERVESKMMFADEVLRSLPAFERNMGNLAASCALKQVPLLLLTMPFSIDVPNPSFLLPGRMMTNDGIHHMQPADFAFGMGRFNEAVLALRDEPRTWVFDLAPKLTETRLFLDEVHFIQEGVKLEGGLVADYILEHRLLGER